MSNHYVKADDDEHKTLNLLVIKPITLYFELF